MDTYNGLYVLGEKDKFEMRARIVKSNPHLKCYYSAALEYAW